MDQIDQLQQLLAEPKKIVIVSHHNPDGDAVGSALALYHFLAQPWPTGQHEVTVLMPNDYPPFIHWMPGDDRVMIYEQQRKPGREKVNQADLIFCLDFNQLKRINELGDFIAKVPALKVLIDHHLEPDDFADFMWWDPKACSTAELVYDFIRELDMAEKINKDVATCLYVGIMTDTGSFRFSSTTAKVHHMVADLIDRGVENTRAHEMIYDSFSESRLRLFGYCFNEKLQVFPEYHTALIAVTADELKRFNAGIGATEGLVNYGLGIQGMKLAALFTDRQNIIKVSLRSKGEFPANEICSKYFDGGGHRNAAGGSSQLTLEETVKKFIDILPLYKEQLVE